MAKYTISIMDKLLEAAGDQSLQNPVVLLNASKTALFGDELEKIDAKYRDVFASGFALHFFKDEIGLETFPLWRMSLIEKIYNNCDYINQTYDLLDKQCFANYRVHKVVTNSNNSATTNTTSENKNSVNSLSTNENNVERKSESNSTNDETAKGITHNTSSNVSTENESFEDTKKLNALKSANEENGSSSNFKEKSVSDGESNSTTKGKTNSEVNSESNNNGNSSSDVEASSSTESTDNRNSKNIQNSNQEQKYSDTPQNGLNDIREDRYLTNVTIASSDSVSTNEESGRKNDTSSSHSSTSTESGSHDTSRSTTNGASESEVVNNESATSNKTGDTFSRGSKKQDETSEQSETSKTKGNKDLNAIITDNGNTTNDIKGNSSTKANDSETANFNGNTTTTGSGETKTDVINNGTTRTELEDISYDMNYEMLINAETLLNRVWRIFDDLFFQLL